MSWIGRLGSNFSRTDPQRPAGIASKKQHQRSYPLSLEERVEMTCRCRDSDTIPKVLDAGRIVTYNGNKVQIMHEGTRVIAGGYHGEWMARIISNLRGHHEPQEEVVFHHILQHVRPSSVIMELGSFWSYYSNWYLGAVRDAKAVCVEPDANNLQCGRRNFSLNSRTAFLINACIGAEYIQTVAMPRESDQQLADVPQHNMSSLFDLTGLENVELLHIDAQGAETPFLASLEAAVGKKLIRFIMVSTHHQSISGSATTHKDCLGIIEGMGGQILAHHSVEQSFSGDGLIAASFHREDKNISIPTLSLNRAEYSLFGPNS